MANQADEVDRLMKTLEGALRQRPGSGDAIDFVLASPERQTAVRSLRHDPVVEAFRLELADGLIRVDTANQLLNLVNAVVTALLTR
ncbi:MAG: hypothetical protein V2A79_05490 [Planctomycetota bacterium]